MKNINVLLFNDFTLMDAFGPIEVFRFLDKMYRINICSAVGEVVMTNPGLSFATEPVTDYTKSDILIVPGGFGTRNLVENGEFIGILKESAEKADYVLSICTGSALLAKTGLLEGRKATSNKMSFAWAMEQGKNVDWIRKARWVVDGKYYTSSGVTAGIDMALGFVSDVITPDAARKISTGMEYIWNSDRDNDPFCNGE